MDEDTPVIQSRTPLCLEAFLQPCLLGPERPPILSLNKVASKWMLLLKLRYVKRNVCCGVRSGSIKYNCSVTPPYILSICVNQAEPLDLKDGRILRALKKEYLNNIHDEIRIQKGTKSRRVRQLPRLNRITQFKR